jgi:O-acetyl-ADP-ribose deacetylase (regulator of RNase III)
MIINGEITTQQVDVIVDAANTTLLGGGGVDGAIHRAAGPELREACQSLGGCHTGEAKITRGYHLPARFVIHTVGPVWQGGDKDEDHLLASSYRNSLELAELSGLQTIAFPAISTGAYGFPLERAARIAISTVIEYLTYHPAIEKVIFVCHGEEAYDIYQELLEGEIASNTEYDVAETLFAHLYIIEASYGISIKNKEEIVKTLGPVIKNEIQALSAGTALNNWIAVTDQKGEITVSYEAIAQIKRNIRQEN